MKRFRVARHRLVSHVELEENYVSVLDDVVAAFLADETLLARRGHRAGCDEIVIRDRLGFDEAFFEIGVDHASGGRRRVSRVNRPGADLLFACRQKSPEAEEVIDGSDE